MQSLKSRFNGSSQEVIEYAKTWGIFKAMDKYDVKDYLAFQKFIEDTTSEKNVGLCPVLGNPGGSSWAEDLLAAFENKLDYWKSKYESLEEKYHKVQLENEYLKTQQALRIEPRIQNILNKCRT